MLRLFVVVALIAVWYAYFSAHTNEITRNVDWWYSRGQYAELQNWNIFYVDEAGTGPSGTLICLHGFPTSSYDWVKILPDLKQQFGRIILLDLLGYGFSEKPTNHEYTIDSQSHIVESLAIKLGIKSAHILAHDYGDTVALELLARHNVQWLKFQILSLTMLNGGIFPEVHRPRFFQKVLQIPVLGYLTSQLSNYYMFSYGFSEVFGENKPTETELLDFWSIVAFNSGYKAFYKIINFLKERHTFRLKWVGALRNAKIKVLMIYGPADPVNPAEFAQVFRTTVPDQTLKILSPQVGHYPQWEDPDAVSNVFIQFIKNLPTP
ncbi:mesoderm-specific transcript protein-like [Physella acuta]|uniref:mesoderm-specific transcript protein-like n=1 Tax=Physella acuta TaxID=109671 RepID=UPI0027DDD714|nr:mesoderm-specific transcript protein-like [Physella acuta]